MNVAPSFVVAGTMLLLSSTVAFGHSPFSLGTTHPCDAPLVKTLAEAIGSSGPTSYEASATACPEVGFLSEICRAWRSDALGSHSPPAPLESLRVSGVKASLRVMDMPGWSGRVVFRKQRSGGRVLAARFRMEPRKISEQWAWPGLRRLFFSRVSHPWTRGESLHSAESTNLTSGECRIAIGEYGPARDKSTAELRLSLQCGETERTLSSGECVNVSVGREFVTLSVIEAWYKLKPDIIPPSERGGVIDVLVWRSDLRGRRRSD
jgi:hypothetical protein